MKNIKLIWIILSYGCWPTLLFAKELTPLLNEIWQYELSTNPIQTTRYGVHQYDDRLADMSPSGLAAQDKQFRIFLKKLSEIDQTKLSRTEHITLTIQQRRLQNHVDQYHFKAHYIPIKSESGFHSALAFLPRTNRFNNKQDYENYITRLEQFPVYFDQQISWMKKGIETGFTQPKTVLQGFEKSVQAFIHDSPEQSVFYAPFSDIKAALSDTEKNALIMRVNKVITHQVFNAYQSFYNFLVNEYIPNSKEKVGANTWKNGLAYYQNRSDFYTTTSMPAEEIHQLGLTEVKRIRNEMQQVVDSLEFEGDINQFIEYLRTAPPILC